MYFVTHRCVLKVLPIIYLPHNPNFVRDCCGLMRLRTEQHRGGAACGLLCSLRAPGPAVTWPWCVAAAWSRVITSANSPHKSHSKNWNESVRSFEYSTTCCVPYGDVVRAPLLHVKGPSNGADGFLEFPLHVPVEQRCLPHVHVSQQDHLDVGFLHLRHLGHVDDEDDEDDDAGLSRSTGELFVLSPHQKWSSF